MRVAIYAEGRSDHAVITNILKGYLNIDQSDIQYDLPEYHLDQTDMAQMQVKEFSTWTVIRENCINSEKIDTFLNSCDDDGFVIIQIDTSERNEPGYNVSLPRKHGMQLTNYCIELRDNVINKIKEWLGNNYLNDKFYFAIAIEEIEAWVLTIYSTANSARFNDPKRALNRELRRQLSNREFNKIFQQKTFRKFFELTRKFRRRRDLINFANNNESRRLFLVSLDDIDH